MGNAAKETAYQADLIRTLTLLLPDCTVLKLPPEQYQGIPDLLILFENKWAMLEVKMSERSPTQPNQPYYVEKFNEMSFAAFIWPAIEDVVLGELVAFMGLI